MALQTDGRGLVARAGAPAFVGAAALGAVFVAGSAWLYSTSPYRHQLGLPCPFLASTGWYCPGCGTTRAFYSLMHGDVSTAFRMNAVFVLFVVPLTAWAVWAVIRSLRGKSVAIPRNPEAWTVALMVFFVAFVVVRNMEFAAPFLAP